MAPPTHLTTIIWFNSPKYKANPASFRFFLDQTRGWEGNVKTYTGFQTEDETTAVWLSVWDSAEQHEGYKATLKEDLIKAGELTSPPKVTVVQTLDTLDDLLKSAGAPATEIVEIKLKREYDDKTAELDGLMNELIDELRAAKGNLGASKGKNARDDKMYVHIIGWTSVQAHWDAVAEGTPLGKVIGRFKEIADIEFIKHAEFTSD